MRSAYAKLLTVIINQSFLRDVGIAASLGATLIAWATTTPITLAAHSIIRNFILLPLAVSTAMLLITRRQPKIFPLSVMICAVLASYGIFVSVIMGGTEHFNLPHVLRFFAFIILFIYLFTARSTDSEIISDRVLSYLVFLALAVLIFTCFSGGFLLSPLPHFSFMGETFGRDQNLSYSLGASRFYGVAAICSALLSRRSDRLKKYMLLVFSFLFLGLCILAGGRGEILITIGLLLIIYRALQILLPLSMISLIILFTTEVPILILTEYADLLDRFMTLRTSVGGRDLLFSKALELLWNEGRCLFFGCGFSFFQLYFDLPAGMYPHNIILEFIVTFGIFLFFGLALFALIGAYDVFKNGENRNIFFLFLFFMLVGMKSGELIHAWFAMAVACYLVAIGVGVLYGSIIDDHKIEGHYAGKI